MSSVYRCCCEGRDPCYRAGIGLAIPLALLITITVIAAFALQGKLLFNRYPVTAPILGYGAIAAGAGSYLLYLTNQRHMLSDCPEFFMALAFIVTPLIIVGGVCVSGHLSLVQTAKAVCVITGVAFAPVVLLGLGGCCHAMYRECCRY